MNPGFKYAAVAGAVALASVGSIPLASSSAEAGWRTGTWRYGVYGWRGGDGWGGGYGWGWRRPNYGGAVAAGLVGGLALGALAASAYSYPAYAYPAYGYPAYAPVNYAYPAYPYVYPRRVVRRVAYRPYPVYYRRPAVRRVVYSPYRGVLWEAALLIYDGPEDRGEGDEARRVVVLL
jgi:hypothetical protein